jgi:ribonuclease I
MYTENTRSRCPCGAQFCYVCGLKWQTCSCELWNEDRLRGQSPQHEAECNPRHRLWRPEQSAYAQRQGRHVRPKRIVPITVEIDGDQVRAAAAEQGSRVVEHWGGGVLHLGELGEGGSS